MSREDKIANLPFGRVRRADFLLAEDVDHLNHGGYGATPRAVLTRAHAWQEMMEADPSNFFRFHLPLLIRQSAARVSNFLGGAANDWAFVENATAGINAIIASLRIVPGDELICLTQVYGAVANALSYYGKRQGARIIKISMPVPFVDPAPLLASLLAAIGPRTKLAIFDHVTSASGTVLPIAEMAAVCREHGVPVAIDGAHAPGQLPLNVPELNVDWYIGNLHKWAFAAKGTGVVWCAPQRQSALHPVSISHYFDQGFPGEFDYSGTRDNSSWLSVPAALDYMEELGLDAMRGYNNSLAAEAGEMIAAAWQTEIASASPFRAAMIAVRLFGNINADLHVARQQVAMQLYQKHHITAGVMIIDDALWIRVSAQIYKELADYERLVSVLMP